jgi:transcriptional regulator with XRE-family HTH domain
MMKKAAKSFGARLRATRELQKMTQTELATRSGLTPAAISQLEGDERDPAFKTLTRLAAALGTSVGFLLGEQKPIVPPELRDFFQNLEELDPQDLVKVRDFTAYLRFQSQGKSR